MKLLSIKMKKNTTKQNRKDKKALSLMIGYVLLIVFAIILGIITYAILKTYVPSQKIECPEGTSLLIENYSCDDDSLTFALNNNGRFDLGGYYILAVDRDSERELKPTVALSVFNTDIPSPILSGLNIEGVKLGMKESPFLSEENNFTVNEVEIESYDLTSVNKLYAIELVPFRWQIEENEKVVVICSDQKIRKRIDCN